MTSSKSFGPSLRVRGRKVLLPILAGAALSMGAATQSVQAASYTWGLNGGGTWDTATANWLLNNTGSLTFWANGANEAIFGGYLTSSRNVGVASGGVTASGITFTALGSSFYTVGTSGNTITLNNGGSNEFINVASGTLGAAVLSGTGGQTISSPLTFTNSLAITNNGLAGMTNLTVSGAINRASAGGSISVGGTGNTSLSGGIGANVTGGLVKSGSGTLNLSGTSAFTGGISVSGGVLATAASNDSLLGAAGNGVALSNGGVLRFATAITSLGTGRVISVGSGGGGIDLNSAVTQTVSGANQITGSGALRLTLSGGTTAGILSVEGANNYSGALTVGAAGQDLVGSVLSQRIFSTSNGATLRLQNAGTLAGTSGITVNNGAAIAIVQPTSAVTGRLGSAPLTFNSGRFSYTSSANGGAAVADTFGPLTANGTNILTTPATTGSTGGTSVTFGTLTRNDNATFYFQSNATGTGQVGGTPGSSTVNFFMGGLSDVGSTVGVRNVIPWAAQGSGSTGNFVSGPMTYDANGFRPLAAAESTSFTTSLASGGNAKGGGTVVTLGNVNSLMITATSTFSTAGTVSVASGWTGFDAATTFNGTSLAFGSATGYFHLSDTVNVQGASQITGTGGVVLSGFSTSFNTLGLTNTSNPFTGGLFINGNAKATFTLDAQLGGSGEAITFGGGQLLYSPSSATGATLTGRTINVNRSNGTVGTTTSGAVLTIPGLIQGTGQMQFGGGQSASASGVVELTGGANTYSGGTVIGTGVLRISSPAQLGTGAVFLNGGTLQAAGNLSFASAPIMGASSTIDTQGNSVTLAGLAGTGGTTGSAATSFVLTKAGSGTLTLSGPSTFAGAVTLGATSGAFTISGSGAAPGLGTVTVGRSSAFNVDDSGVANAGRTGLTTGVTLSNGGTTGGATLNITTNAAGSALTFGALTLSGGVSGNVNTSTLNVIDGGSGTNTITFAGLSGLSSTNLLNVVGTANLGLNVPGGTRIFFLTAPTLTGGVVANLTFTGFGGTGPATYDSVLGLVRLDQTTGTFIDNLNNVGAGTPTGLTTAFVTSGATQANLGATIKSLTIAGHTVTLNSGVYSAQSGNGFAAADSLVLANGSLTTTTGASSITSASATKLTFGSAGNVQANVLTNAGADLTIGANVTPTTTGGLLKSGTGALTIAGTNNITGDYNIQAGVVNLPSSGTSASSLTGVSGATMNLGGGALNVSAATSTAYAGVLAGSTAGLNVGSAGTGALTLSGTNTFTGPVSVQGGSLLAGSATALGNAANTVGVSAGATLGFTGGITVASAYPTTINGAGAAGSSGAIDNVSGTNSYAGPITLASNATIGATSGQLTLSGGISGAGAPTFNPTGSSTLVLSTVALNLGANSLAKTGTGTLVLPNLANTLGGINASGGLVRASADNNLGANTGPINLSNGAGLQYGAVFTMDPARSITLGTGGGAIDTQSNNVSFAVPMGGAGSFIKLGSGTLTVNAAQAYAGSTIVRAGVLTLGAANALPATPLVIGNALSADNTAQLNLNGLDLSVPGLTFVAKNSGGASAQVTGAGTLTVNGPIAFVDNATTPGNSFPVSVASTVTAVNLGGAVRNLTIQANNNSSGDLVFNAPITNGGLNYTGTPSVANGAVAVLNLAAANTFAQGLTVNAGTVSVAAAGTLGAATSPLTIQASGTVNSLVTLSSAQTIGTLSGGTTSGTATATLAMGSNALTINQAIDAPFNGVLTGSGALTKQGPGTLILGGTANTHTGVVNVNAGALIVNGLIASSTTNAVAVAGGATLGGSGTIGRNVNVAGGGFISPGNSAGLLTMNGNLTLSANGTLVVEINGVNPGTDYDVLAVNGTVNVTNALLNATMGYAPSMSDKFFIIVNDAADAITGTFAGLPDGSTVALGGPWSGQISYFGDSATGALTGGNDVVIYNVVPAPGAAALLGVGGLMAARRRRR
jgi:autotransporter-associated beta strand protein